MLSRAVVIFTAERFAAPTGHRIHAAWATWVAFHDAFGSHPAAFERTVHLDGLDGIGRAAWPETAARAKQWADGVLVNANTAYHHCC